MVSPARTQQPVQNSATTANSTANNKLQHSETQLSLAQLFLSNQRQPNQPTPQAARKLDKKQLVIVANQPTNHPRGHKMNNILTQNVDRSDQKLRHIIQQLVGNSDLYTAALLQGCPKDIDLNKEQSLNATCGHLRAVSPVFPDFGTNDLSTRLITIINSQHCAIKQQRKIGDAKTAALILEIELINNKRPTGNQNFFLANVYIRPQAEPLNTKGFLQSIAEQSIAEYTNFRTSRLLLAGDVNASSALWDPLNQENVMTALKTKNQHYAFKTQRGSVIERFAGKFQLTALLQTARPIPTFTESDIRNSWIDIVLVGRKAHRVWHNIQVMEPQKDQYRQHLPIRIAAATSQQGKRAPKSGSDTFPG